MQRSLIGKVVAAGALSIAGFAATATAVQDPAAAQHIIVVGCVSQTATGAFELAQVEPVPVVSRSTGSNSAKASTPIGGAPASDRRRTANPTTAKASAPIQAAPAAFRSFGAGGSNNPKSSTPVGRPAPPTYALDVSGSDVGTHTGQIVEITGSLSTSRVLTVEIVRGVAPTCAQ